MAHKKAILFMILAALLFTIMNSIVRSLNHLPVFELVFFRAVGSMVCGFTILRQQKVPILGKNRKLLILRAIVGVTAMSLFFKAIQMMPLGSAVALRYLSPFFAAGLAIVLLKEKMHPLQWVFFGTAFMGIVLLKGFDSSISMAALGIILISAFLSGLVYIIIRKVSQTEHPVVVVNYFMSVSTLVGGFFCLFHWVTPVGIQWVSLLSLGLFGFIAQVCMTKALQLAEANLIVPFKYIEVILTLIIGWLLFQEDQTSVALVGIAIILLSLLANVWVKGKG